MKTKIIRLPKALKIVFIIILIIYFLFVLTRLTGRYLTYIPFSGRVFSFSENDVEMVDLMHYEKVVAYSSLEEKKLIIEKLGALHYVAWLPDPGLLLGMGGQEYRIRIWKDDNTLTQYAFGDHYIKANGFVYVMRKSQMNELINSIKQAYGR